MLSWARTLWQAVQRLAYHLSLFTYELLFLLVQCPELLPAHFRLWELSIRHSPYRAYQKHTTLQTQSIGEKDLTYGEISLPSIDRALQCVQATPSDQLFDLGSGRGRVVLLAAARKIPSLGVEYLPSLVQAAEYAKGQGLKCATFKQADMLTIDLEPATILWLAGTCWQEHTRVQLAEQIAQLSSRPWILSVSAPMPHPSLILQKQIPIWTTWGKDKLFIQKAQESTAITHKEHLYGPT